MSSKITTRQLAEMLGVIVNTVKRWRKAGVGPRYTRSGSRGGRFRCVIHYSASDVAAWIAARKSKAVKP